MTLPKQLGLLRRSGVVAALVATGIAGTLAAQTGTPALGFDRRNLDTSVRPQDDFFRYVNGGWLKTTQIPADRSSFGSFVELRDRSEESLRAIIEEAAAARNAQPGSETQKVGDLYRSFMDSARVEAAGITPIRPELARIAALRDRAALPELFAHLQRIGVQTP
ncbi:MAG TPA: hypothetical protein VK358_01090, partial [Longimicrobium sp.]|nr:hypothetical protein [Longimicrobium sp.]